MRAFQFKPRHPVTQLVFSPDGSALATAQPHTGVAVRDLATGEPLQVCPLPRSLHIDHVRFSPDGRFLAASHSRGLDAFLFDNEPATPAASYHYTLTNSYHWPCAGMPFATRMD